GMEGPGGGRRTGTPLARVPLPSSISCSPAITLSSVVLPEPLGPIRPTRSPWPSRSDTASKIIRSAKNRVTSSRTTRLMPARYIARSAPGWPAAPVATRHQRPRQRAVGLALADLAARGPQRGEPIRPGAVAVDQLAVQLPHRVAIRWRRHHRADHGDPPAQRGVVLGQLRPVGERVALVAHP